MVTCQYELTICSVPSSRKDDCERIMTQRWWFWEFCAGERWKNNPFYRVIESISIESKSSKLLYSLLLVLVVLKILYTILFNNNYSDGIEEIIINDNVVHISIIIFLFALIVEYKSLWFNKIHFLY